MGLKTRLDESIVNVSDIISMPLASGVRERPGRISGRHLASFQLVFSIGFAQDIQRHQRHCSSVDS